LPTVVVTTSGFSVLARFTGKAGGVDDLQIAEYPGPLGIHEAQEIENNIAQVLVERIVTGLTATTGGAATKRAAAQDPRAIVFTGTAEEVDRYFLAQEWSDGLPVVAPTLERVASFLRYTDRAHDEEIAILPSANLRATPWNIAVNGVMAGLATSTHAIADCSSRSARRSRMPAGQHRQLVGNFSIRARQRAAGKNARLRE
jgi:hypothetical protein